MAKITWETPQENIDKLKIEKTNELKESTSEKITKGFYSEVKMIRYFFSYSMEKQINFQDTNQLFTNQMILNVEWNCYKENGEKVRLLLNADEFQNIYLAGISHKQTYINYLNNELLTKVKNALTEKEIMEIKCEGPKTIMVFDKTNTIDKKIEKIPSIELQNRAQKGYNEYMEETMLEVVDMLMA